MAETQLPRADENANPLELFQLWLAAAERTEPNDPNAMALATATPTGTPSVRMVLLKAANDRGFTFYTNVESRKGKDLSNNPQAALCLHWKTLRRQIRIEGRIETVDDIEADTYFHSRSRVSQLGAWASQQSRILSSRSFLERRLQEIEALYPGDTIVPRPPYWVGFRVVPETIEFWQDGAYRLHDRMVYTREGEQWVAVRLYP